MEHLQKELQRLLSALPNEQEVHDRLQNLVSVYPFNEYEYICAMNCPFDPQHHGVHLVVRALGDKHV